jgi:serine O-acetyltransferase
VFENIQADFRRYLKPTQGRAEIGAIVDALISYGFIATCVYRYGRWTRTIQPKILSYPFKLTYYLLHLLVDLTLGINISTNADIGPGLYVGHFGGIFLHGDMGANCSVTQGVTVGYKGGGKSTHPPRVGNNVYIGAGAFVIGNITVGDNSVIGANTTVVKDVPPDSLVVSAEPRVIQRPKPQQPG